MLASQADTVEGFIMKMVTDAFSDFIAVSEVLSARLPMLALTMAHPTPARRLEAERMVLEKADAAMDGLFSLHKYCVHAALDSMIARPVDNHLEGAISAYMEPGRKTLRANADRLRGQMDI